MLYCSQYMHVTPSRSGFFLFDAWQEPVLSISSFPLVTASGDGTSDGPDQPDLSSN
jgi:hypothetical protein